MAFCNKEFFLLWQSSYGSKIQHSEASVLHFENVSGAKINTAYRIMIFTDHFNLAVFSFGIID
jgi:hypothetical protein